MKVCGSSLKTLVICGAGATLGAVGSVRINNRKISPPLNRDFFKILENFSKAYEGKSRTIVDQIKRLNEVIESDLPRTRGEKRKPTMEDVFSLLYVTQNLHGIYDRRRRRKKRAVKKARREIEDFLEITFRLLSDIQHEIGDERTGYNDLVESLQDGDTIITLNYDTILDAALAQNGWSPTAGYGFSVSASRLKWRTETRGNKLDVSLLKLHGSLNWLAKGSYSKPSDIFEKRLARIVNPTAVKCPNGYIRQIVPPVFGKTFAHQHWDDLWNQAFLRIQEVDRLIVIGCSLVPTDFHLSGMLYKAVAKRKERNKPFHEVFIVNGRKNKNSPWAMLVKGCHQRKPEFYSKFGNFCEKALAR